VILVRLLEERARRDGELLKLQGGAGR
jgi:hypothetical protein